MLIDDFNRVTTDFPMIILQNVTNSFSFCELGNVSQNSTTIFVGSDKDHNYPFIFTIYYDDSTNQVEISLYDGFNTSLLFGINYITEYDMQNTGETLEQLVSDNVYDLMDRFMTNSQLGYIQ